jgi:cation diffusion facilitator family transporter
MHTESLERWLHDHTFGQDGVQPGERRTVIVIGITAVTMAAEIVGGVLFGSMALLADGLHMGSHATALAIAAFAYRYTRRHARDRRFNFGTGKVNALAAFASAVLLMVFALVMAWESVRRLIFPVDIAFNLAVLVAGIGLGVNAVSLVILKGHGHERHGADAGAHESVAHRHDSAERGHGHSAHADQNLLAAYVHVLADTLTSLLAIAALLGGKYLGLRWLDPLMGLVGAALISWWSWGLIRASSRVLLDMQTLPAVREAICAAIEREGDNRLADVHVWSVGPGIFAAELSVVTSEPRSPDHYRALLPAGLGLVHVTAEVHRCAGHDEPQ